MIHFMVMCVLCVFTSKHSEYCATWTLDICENSLEAQCVLRREHGPPTIPAPSPSLL